MLGQPEFFTLSPQKSLTVAKGTLACQHRLIRTSPLSTSQTNLCSRYATDMKNSLPLLMDILVADVRINISSRIHRRFKMFWGMFAWLTHVLARLLLLVPPMHNKDFVASLTAKITARYEPKSTFPNVLKRMKWCPFFPTRWLYPLHW